MYATGCLNHTHDSCLGDLQYFLDQTLQLLVISDSQQCGYNSTLMESQAADAQLTTFCLLGVFILPCDVRASGVFLHLIHCSWKLALK